MAEDKDITRLEDIGAIAVEFGSNERYGELREKLGPYLAGFTGLWGFVATVGDVFHDEARRIYAGQDAWDGDSWPESVFATVEEVMAAAIEKPEAVPGDNFSKAQREWIQKYVRIV